MNIVRKIKISHLIDMEYTEDELKILDIINDILENMVEYTPTFADKSIFYMNKTTGNYIFEINNIKDKLFINGIIYREINTLTNNIKIIQDIIEFIIKKFIYMNKNYIINVGKDEISFTENSFKIENSIE